MNQMIVPKVINFNELVKNSNTTLSLDLQSKMIAHLNTEFTEQEQQWYIANLFVYLNYHPTNDYPINLENVYKMLGFANKGNAMKTIKSNFTLDEDYKLILIPREKKQNAGRSEHAIILNVDTFKNLCMLVKTDKGKDIRKYYVKLENLYNKMIKEELENKDKHIDSLETEVKTVRKQLQKRSNQKWLHVTPGDAVYAVKSDKNDPFSLISIGKSKNISERESNYLTHNQESNMFYIKKCRNCNLAEKVLHHLLMSKRVNEREWFTVSEDIAIYCIDLVCTFLDSFVDSIDNLPQTELLQSILDLSQTQRLSIVGKESTQNVKVNDNTMKEFDYNTFIQEYCVIDPNYFSIPEELIGAYKLWSRVNVNTNKKNLLFKHLQTKFTMEKRYLDCYNAAIRGYVGVKPKPFVFNIVNEQLKNFISEKCEIGYIHKITEQDLLHSYEEYIDHPLIDDDLILLKAELNFQFFYGGVNCSLQKKKYGYIGFKLKSAPDTIHCLRNKSTRKAIVKINVHTQQIEAEYNSLNATAFALNKRYETIVTYLRKRSVFDDCYMLQYKSNVNDV